MQDRRKVGIAAGAMLIALAAVVIIVTNRPPQQADLQKAFFTHDDGKTWFAASAYSVAPFEHDGKEAVQAMVFSYAKGSKQFCAYLTKFTPEGKKRIEEEYAKAKAAGKPPESVALLRDRKFIQSVTLVKAPGAKEWMPMNDPKVETVLTIRSPDGSEHDQVFVY